MKILNKLLDKYGEHIDFSEYITLLCSYNIDFKRLHGYLNDIVETLQKDENFKFPNGNTIMATKDNRENIYKIKQALPHEDYVC